MLKSFWQLRSCAVFSRVLLLLLLMGYCFASSGSPATITFSLDFPKSDPTHYVITTSSDGHARYECEARVSGDSDQTAPYKYDFTLTPATRDRIFKLAAQSKFFSGKVDSGNRKLAFTGSKKLTYADARRTSTAEYNYSSETAVTELTDIFQKMAATMDYGRRISFEHRYQKLALDDELKSLESQARSGELQEVQALQPLLQQVADDNSVMNIDRARALRIIQLGNPLTAK